METKANYVLIGACTLVAIVLGLGFFVWLAKFQVDRQYAYYDVYFDSVSGLNRAAEVRFSGLTVGQVQSLELATDGTGRVRVRIEVAAETPIREGATAQLQAQGVTGVSFVSISPGPAGAPLMRVAGGEIPVIPGERSVVQSLTEDAPDLLQESIKLVREFQNIVGAENQAKVTGILGNIEAASGKLEQALADFTSISKTVSDATGQISLFTDKLDPIAASVDSVLGETEKTLGAMTVAFSQAGTTLATADVALKTVDGAATGVSGLIDNQAADALTELKGTITDLRDHRRCDRHRGKDGAGRLRRRRGLGERPADRAREDDRRPRHRDRGDDRHHGLGRCRGGQRDDARRRRRHCAGIGRAHHACEP